MRISDWSSDVCSSDLRRPVNAPFKAAGLREPFNAFVCDDDTLELIRIAAGDMGWPVEKCNKGGLRNAVQSLSVSASPNILFVDMSESGDPINDINALAEVCEPGTVVIAAGQVNDVRLYRDLLSSGIQRSEEHTSRLQTLMRIQNAVC